MPPEPLPTDALTPREREVFQAVANGVPNNKIARGLSVSTSAVAMLLARARERLSLGPSTPAAIAECMRRGWLT